MHLGWEPRFERCHSLPSHGPAHSITETLLAGSMGELMLIWAAELLSLGLVDNWSRILGN